MILPYGFELLPNDYLERLSPDYKKTFSSIDPNTLNSDLEKSFFDKHQITPVLLSRGARLGRFVQNDVIALAFSEYWMPVNTLIEMELIFNGYEKGHEEAIYKEVIRDNLGILSEWNTMRFKVEIEIKTPTIGYMGIIAPQKMMYRITKDGLLEKKNEFTSMNEYFEMKNSNELFFEARMGGYYQVVIPSFGFSQGASIEGKLGSIEGMPQYSFILK